MFLDLTEGSFLWAWYQSPLGIVALVTSIMVAIIMIGARPETYSGRLLAFLAVASVLLTFPSGLGRMGIASDLLGTGLVVEVGFLGFGLAIACVAVPCLLWVLLHAIKPELVGRVQLGDLHGGYGTSSAEPSLDILTSFEPHQEPDVPGPDLIPDELSDQWEIEFIDGSAVGRRIQIASKEITLGRSTDNDVVVDDPYVSRQHATVSAREGELHLTDLESTGGTLVDGLSVDRSTLRPGSSVVLGGTTLRFTKSSMR